MYALNENFAKASHDDTFIGRLPWKVFVTKFKSSALYDQVFSNVLSWPIRQSTLQKVLKVQIKNFSPVYFQFVWLVTKVRVENACGTNNHFQGVMIFSLARYNRMRYGPNEDDETYPWYSELFGWFLALSSMVCIPIYAIYKWTTTPGTFAEVYSWATVCRESFLVHNFRQRKLTKINCLIQSFIIH